VELLELIDAMPLRREEPPQDAAYLAAENPAFDLTGSDGYVN
jgi:hypothetical protein